ncbi:glycolate oxidase iron-sulfur subunit [Anoxybacillus voinovskiensis]|uniref:Glycolate oxidase iron-sulfur subunit n=1 Tax=Anoxybacteroides voinovskiense TaxID=230470 RepID=A0A840DI92_9BACL|nr:(Fe-S)-binding protein [Anoxybacillus voinovskiensis]MBB4072470.1 glycolate oxidase iron-sulfur subunit [Anoxybacillus voinovskiensis]GGJ57642.1 putative glycolate oxidase iron-sulfur subunit [Anoxybacillus voinovskiensis]
MNSTGQNQAKTLGNYRWGDLPDPNKWADCVHCGMCLESCPTYEQTGQEQHSPRGRVHLMKAVAEGKLEITEDFIDPIFACLDCRACTTACPADVDVGGLIEEVRWQIRQAIPLTGTKAFISKLFLQGIFPHPSRLQALGRLLKLYQKSGLQKLVRQTGLLRLFPDHLAEMEAVLPAVGEPVRKKYKHSLVKAKGETKRTVALLTGCVMDVMFSDINEATIRVLTYNGNDVVIPPTQTCCGALHVHAGDKETGKMLAKQNIEAFQDVERVVVNAAGCGCMLKEYPELFRDDPVWHEKATQFSEKVEDISKYLYDTGYERPKAELAMRITYHDACHLAHGQGIRQEPRAILASIPGVELVEMPNADRCCGSAGIYNITHPEMAQAVLQSKMENIPNEVEIISMGNPGCMLQMAIGVLKHGRNEKIVHTVQLLDWAYQKENGKEWRT